MKKGFLLMVALVFVATPVLAGTIAVTGTEINNIGEYPFGFAGDWDVLTVGDQTTPFTYGTFAIAPLTFQAGVNSSIPHKDFTNFLLEVAVNGNSYTLLIPYSIDITSSFDTLEINGNFSIEGYGVHIYSEPLKLASDGSSVTGQLMAQVPEPGIVMLLGIGLFSVVTLAARTRN
jgi:hypothetical protein